MNMQIKESGGTNKPKNFSRKIFICSCLCPVVPKDSKGSNYVLDKVMVKYEIIPNKDFHYEEPRSKHYWSSYEHWGDFKKVIELPPIFSIMNDDDFIVYTGYFVRDKVQMPFISKIEIINPEKYKMLILKEQRKDKLNKIKIS